MDVSQSCVAVMFDLRTSFLGQDSNTGLLVATQVVLCEMRLDPAGVAEREPHPRLANMVGESRVTRENGEWSTSIVLFFGGDISIRARRAKFHAGNVDLGRHQHQQPDFGLDSAEVINARMPSWDSLIEVVSTSSLELP